MNIINKLKNILEASSYISSVNIDYTENTVGNFGLYNTGTNLISTSITGKKTYSANFVLYFFSNSFDDISRINNTGLIDNISNYLNGIYRDKITEINNNNSITTGEIISVNCSNGMLFNVPNSVNDGYTYQIQIKVKYEIYSEPIIEAIPQSEPEEDPEDETPSDETLPCVFISGYTVSGDIGSMTIKYLDDSGNIVEPENATKVSIRNNGSFYWNNELLEAGSNGKATLIKHLPV